MASVSSPASDEKDLKTPAITRRRFLVGGAALCAASGMYSAEWERHWIEIERHEIKVRSLPDAFEGFTIAQMSDIHFGEFTEAFFLQHAVEMMNALKPDMVALTGDFITTNHHDWWANVRAAEACTDILNGLECKLRYATLGNHDVIAKFHVTQALTRKGNQVLDNAFTSFEHGGARMWIGGLADAYMDKPDPAKALPERKEDEPLVLLGHEPDIADLIRGVDLAKGGPGVDLMLAGHTHGGQVNLPLLAPMFLPDLGKKYVKGLFHLDTMQLYVNRGLGTVHLPFRVNCRPEIALLTLRRG